MFLKLVSKKLKLPFVVMQRGLAFVFPEGKLPSVCIESFTDEGGKGLMGKFPGAFETASEEEVVRARKEAEAPAGSGKSGPVVKLKGDDVLVGTVTAADFENFTSDEAFAFLTESKLSIERAQDLLVFEGQNRNDKDVKKAIREYIKSLGD